MILQKQNLITNYPNDLPILLYNKGSADANGVIVTITNISGGTTTIGDKDQNDYNSITDDPIFYNNSESTNNIDSNYTISNKPTNITTSTLAKQLLEKEPYVKSTHFQTTYI